MANVIDKQVMEKAQAWLDGNYDEAIIRPFNKAVEEIENNAEGSLQIEFNYDNINTFLAGKMTVGIDDTMTEYIQKIERSRLTKQLEGKKRRKKADDQPEP